MTGARPAARVVVYGDYPPSPTPGAAATLAIVRGLLAEGREVEVVSPKPSAAQHHADVGHHRGAAKLARLVGGTELVAQFDPGILGRSSGAGPAAARAATALAVRRARSATIHLSPLTAPPAGKWVRSILDPAVRVAVASREDADTLEAAGLDAAKLEVAEHQWWLAPTRQAVPAVAGGPEAAEGAEAWTIPDGASREEVEAEVRRRAARDREDAAANPLPASSPLQMIPPLAPAPFPSSNPILRAIRRSVHRLIAWEVVRVVDQLNRLQRATIDALDRQSEAAVREPSGDRR